MKAFASALFLSLGLVGGCATTSGLSPSVSKSGFDGATVVNIVPHGNVCAEHCTQIGAQWSSKSPSQAVLTIGVLGYSGFHSINQVDLRIDEDVLRLSPNPGLTRHEHNASSVFYESQKDFTVPLSLLRKILSSRDVWLRIGTNDGVIEDAIIENERDSKGFNALKRFIADVDAQQ